MGRFKVVTFHSEGAPHDYALPLTDCMMQLREVVEMQGIEFDAYTPRRIRDLNAGHLVRHYEEKYALPMNPGLHRVGMAAWKPFIMLHAMDTFEDGDVLIYSDVNVLKYPGLKLLLEDARNFSVEALGEFDFFVGREKKDQTAKTAEHSSARQIIEIGANTVFACNFPIHIVNRLVVRSSAKAREILEIWLALCMQERFMLPPLEGDITHPSYRWFCPEQSVLNMVLAALIEEGKLPYYYAGRGFDRNGVHFLADNDHVAHLLSPHLRDGYVPLTIRFAKEIEDARRYMQERSQVIDRAEITLRSA